MPTARLTVATPVGDVTIAEANGVVTSLNWGGSASDDTPVLRQARDELQDYFAGQLQAFTVPIELGSTAFQRSFLQSLIDIPYGETREYGELAKDLGVSAQAIGQACGANRIPILIPCHRVLAANGLGGYSGSGGIETKVALLKLEGAGGLLI